MLYWDVRNMAALRTLELYRCVRYSRSRTCTGHTPLGSLRQLEPEP